MKPKIFIDGEHGTTGLQIRAMLAGRGDLEIISIPAEHRKDQSARKDFLNRADLAVLCLPDDAARESVALVKMPTLVLCGDRDDDNGSADALAVALPDGQRGTIPGNHMSCITFPSFGEAMADYLAA